MSFGNFSLDLRIIDFTSLLAASMEDDGITSERACLHNSKEKFKFVGALVSLK